MWFKALRIYQARRPLNLTDATLEAALTEQAFTPCHSQQEQSAGWVAPLDGGGLAHAGPPGHWLLKLRIEERLLPSAVIKEALDEEVRQIEANEGRQVGRKERRNRMDELKITLLPQAFTRSRYLLIWIDNNRHRVIINHGSEKWAELALNRLREGLGSLPVVPLATQLTPTQVMTQWLLDTPPAGITPLDACELKDPDTEGAVLRCRGQNLLDDEILQHLQAGKRVTQLKLDWRDQVSFVLTEQLQLKSLSYADVLQEEAEQSNPDQDPRVALDTHFVLMSGTLGPLFDELIDHHQGLVELAEN